MLVRGGALSGAEDDEGKGAPVVLAIVWLRVGWLVVVHPKQRPKVDVLLSESFSKYVAGGGFPICSSFLTPGRMIQVPFGRNS